MAMTKEQMKSRENNPIYKFLKKEAKKKKKYPKVADMYAHFEKVGGITKPSLHYASTMTEKAIMKMSIRTAIRLKRIGCNIFKYCEELKKDEEKI